MLIKLSLFACFIGVLAYLILQPSKNEFGLTKLEISQWENFTKWLHQNGVTNYNVTLAYFEGSGRGLAVTKDFEEGEIGIAVPFSLALNSERFKSTELGKALKETNPYFHHANYAVFFSVCLLYERIRQDSFWEPYIKLLPTDFSNMPLYFTEEEKQILDGSLKSPMKTQRQHLDLALKAASNLEAKYPKYKGLADEEGLKWALCTIHSRVFDIPELGGGTMIPLIDFLNHNPYYGKPLDIIEETGTVVARKTFKKGEQFYLKYYSDKTDSDSTYFMTYGFRFDVNDTSTHQISYNYFYPPLENEIIQKILKMEKCGERGNFNETLTSDDTSIPPKFLRCLCILSLDKFFNDEITEENFSTHFTQEVQKNAVKLASSYVEKTFEKFSGAKNEEELLRRSNLSYNTRNILQTILSEKKVLNRARDIIANIQINS